MVERCFAAFKICYKILSDIEQCARKLRTASYHASVRPEHFLALEAQTILVCVTPSSKYHTALFKVLHHPLQSTTPPSSKYHTANQTCQIWCRLKKQFELDWIIIILNENAKIKFENIKMQHLDSIENWTSRIRTGLSTQHLALECETKSCRIWIRLNLQ